MNENFCTTYREFFGFVNSLTIYELFKFGSDHIISVLNDLKPTISCFSKKGNLSPVIYTAHMQWNKFQKLRFNYTKEENFSVADMLSRSHTQKKLQLNQLKHKQIPLQIRFATLTKSNLYTICSNTKLYLLHKKMIVILS